MKKLELEHHRPSPEDTGTSIQPYDLISSESIQSDFKKVVGDPSKLDSNADEK